MSSSTESHSVTPFQQLAQPLREQIDHALRQCLEYGPGCPTKLHDAIEHSLMAPSKRLRPILVLLATEACGGEPEKAMPAACAVEMIHTYSLIHDDLPAMDDDDMRRGRPSCHRAFGEATAILAGDALLAQAFEVLATQIKPPATAALCCAELAQAAGATELVGGQEADLSSTAGGGDLEQLQAIHRRKTGAMFRVSLRLGGLVALGSEDQLHALEAYGTHLGLAFQIIDDLLDTQGEAATLGKTVGKDQEQAKLTFPSLLGIEASRRRATELIEAANAALAPFESSASGLQALAQFVLQRNH